MQIIRYLLLIFLYSGIFTSTYSQGVEQYGDWTSFYQFRDVSFVKKKVKFKLSASVKVITEDTSGWSGLWVRIDTKNGERGFFDNMSDRPIKSNEWKTYIIEGELNENSDKIYFGGLCLYNGKFYFDNFEFFVQNEEDDFVKLEIENSGFEYEIKNNIIPNWQEGIIEGKPKRIKSYNISSNTDSYNGKYSILIEGEKVQRDSTYMIGPRNGFSPQIGTLITMLNNLSFRVEQEVHGLSQRELDHLFDEKANRIGALIMHLAAAEKWYQVYTFENRGFNEKEKEKWQVAMNLGEEARKSIKGHNLKYYLDLYKEVRKTTIEELKKRDDAWLNKSNPGSDTNNHFHWFHIAEHQSSHLGQIRFLMKRIPKTEEPKVNDFKIETNK